MKRRDLLSKLALLPIIPLVATPAIADAEAPMSATFSQSIDVELGNIVRDVLDQMGIKSHQLIEKFKILSAAEDVLRTEV